MICDYFLYHGDWFIVSRNDSIAQTLVAVMETDISPP